MIKYVKGNLLEAPQKIIAHQVNCQGVMGSGVALAVRNTVPYAYIKYWEWFQLGNAKLGRTQIIHWKDKDKYLINIFSQDDYLPRDMRHTNYEALCKGFETIKAGFGKEDLAMPKIGCGLGGGDWRIVSAIIESVFDDRDVYVYELE